jgi:AcrR family transcriptional regulator
MGSTMSKFETNPEPATDDTRQRILEAAARVFAQEGYARATTRALAAAAGVNEVTLFRHFGSKKNLFAAIIDEFAAPAMTRAWEARGAMEAQWSGDYRQDLLLMGRQVMQVLLERKEALRLMLCESTHFPEVREAMAQNPQHLRQMLARYLQQQMDRGQVRPQHAEALAQAFWGMFFAYSIQIGFFGEPLQPEISTEELVVQFVDLFVQGTSL